jgi:hypothetical protein
MQAKCGKSSAEAQRSGESDRLPIRTEEMSLSTQLQTFIEVLAAVAAFGSAVFWYEAALVWIALAGF